VHFLHKKPKDISGLQDHSLPALNVFMFSAFELTCIPKVNTLNYTFINLIGHFYSRVWKQTKKCRSRETCLQKVSVSSLSWREGCLDWFIHFLTMFWQKQQFRSVH
jgi:hypothetical protein